MNRTYFTRFAHALRTTLGDRHLTARGRESGHCRRLRSVTPQRLVCALVEALGSLRVRTIADILRTFNAQTGLATRYKAFYNRLARPEFPVFIRKVYIDILRKLSQDVLKATSKNHLSAFSDVVIQDGSSFAVHDALATTFGGRFTKIRPAAVELHAFVSVFKDQVINTQLSPDKDSERKFLPVPQELTDKLLLADRGYPSLDYFEKLIDAGAFFVMRAKSDMNPKVLSVRGPGGQLPRFEGCHLKDIVRGLPRRRLDLQVEWERPAGCTLQLRMVFIWVPQKKKFTILVTNVRRSVLTAKQVGEVYRLRWQVELVFKEWKSSSNLHEFASANPAIVEGLIWASLCAAALKRSLAHACQRTGGGVAVSTQVAAMCGAHILRDLLRCALEGFRDLEFILKEIFGFLLNNSARAHPKRDQTRGRMRSGLAYVGFGR